MIFDIVLKPRRVGASMSKNFVVLPILCFLLIFVFAVLAVALSDNPSDTSLYLATYFFDRLIGVLKT